MNAKWLPYLFTSCPGGAGLQVHSRSAALAKEELAALSVAARYEPSPSAPSTPTDEELAAFPVKHGFLRFSTGRYGIFRSQYVGRESAEPGARFGNYMVEAFVRADGTLPRHPALYLDSPSFRDALAFRDKVFAESVDMERPFMLEDLAEDAVRPRADVSDAQRREAFSRHADLYAGLLGRLGGGVLLLEGVPSRDALRHLECVQTALPLALAHGLTAVTYTQSGSSKEFFAFQATAELLPGYVRQEFKVKSDCVLYDAAAAKQPAGTLTRFLAESCRSSWQDPADFFGFLGLLRPEELAGQLDVALLLWRLLEKPEQACNAEEFGQALALGLRAGTGPFFARALARIASEPVLAELLHQPTLEKTLRLFEFLHAAPLRELPAQPAAKLQLLMEASAAFLWTGEPGDAPPAVRAMLDLDPPLAASLLAGRLYDQWIHACAAAVAAHEGEVTRACFQCVSEVISRLPATAPASWRDRPAMEDMAHALGRAAAGSGFQVARYFDGLSAPAVATGWRLLAETLKQTPTDPARSNLLVALGAHYDSLPTAEQERQTQGLLAAGYEECAVEMLSRRMFDSPGRLVTTMPSLLAARGLQDSARRQILEAGIAFLRNHHDLPALTQVVSAHEKPLVASGLAGQAVAAMAAIFPPPPWTAADTGALQAIRAFASRQKTVLPPRLAMAAALADPKMFPPAPDADAKLENWVREIESIPDTKEYGAYASYLLTKLWPRVKSPDQIEPFARRLCITRQNDFVDVYFDFLGKTRGEGRMSPARIWSVVRLTDGLFRGQEPIWRKLRPVLVETLTAASHTNFTKARDALDMARPPISDAWDNIFKQADTKIRERESRSLSRRLGRLFTGIGGLFVGKPKKKKKI